MKIEIPELPKGKIDFWKIGDFFKALPQEALSDRGHKIYYFSNGRVNPKYYKDPEDWGSFWTTYLAHLFKTKEYFTIKDFDHNKNSTKNRDSTDGIMGLYRFLRRLKLVEAAKLKETMVLILVLKQKEKKSVQSS